MWSKIGDFVYTIGWSFDGAAGGITAEPDGTGVFVGVARPGPIFDVDESNTDGTQGIDVDPTSVLAKSGPIDLYTAGKFIFDNVVDTYSIDGQYIDGGFRAYIDRYDQIYETIGDKTYNYGDNLHIQ